MRVRVVAVLFLAGIATVTLSLLRGQERPVTPKSSPPAPAATPSRPAPPAVKLTPAQHETVLAAQRGQHIAVTAIQGLLGRGGNRVLLIGHQLLIAATFFYLAWVGLDVIEITGTEEFPVTGITARWAYLALIVGFVGLGLTALTTLGRLLLATDPLAVRAHHLEEDV